MDVNSATMQSLESRLRRYSLTPFGKDSGPRGDMIFKELEDAGLNPVKDEKGNIIVIKNPSKKTSVLVSSHMDTVFGSDPGRYAFGETGLGDLLGCFDNAIGCAINMELALKTSPRIKTYHAFTVEEETGGEGAKHVISEIIKPSPDTKEPGSDPLCITLDVTSDDFGEPFNVENIFPGLLIRRVNELAERHYGKRPTLSPDGVFDESMVYGKLARAFSVCPVVSGNMHSNSCTTERESFIQAYGFLESVLNSRGLEKEVQEVVSGTGFVRKIATEARNVVLSRGHATSKFVYHAKEGREWATYFVIPHTGRFDTSLLDHETGFYDSVKKYAEGLKLRDELDITYGELNVEAKPVLNNHRYVGTSFDYKITLLPPTRLKAALKTMEEAFQEEAEKAKAWFYDVDLEFSTRGKNSVETIANTFNRALALYEGATGGRYGID